jgi:hypothetical protein
MKWGILASALVTLALSARLVGAADSFGDISVDADAMYTGSTFHGYAETRVTLENHSSEKSHVVTLYYPDHAWNNGGNNIGRISRKVVIEPGAREMISLLQPPLQAGGDGQIHVDVDRQWSGAVHAPNGGNHCNYFGAGFGPNVLVSRSLNFNATEKLFQGQAGKTGFTPSMATGAPDCTPGGQPPEAWMPDIRVGSPRRGIPDQWLELDYATPQPVTTVKIFSPNQLRAGGYLNLISAGGTNVARIPLAAGVASSATTGWLLQFSAPTNATPVKTVRLEFENTPPSFIAVDALEISDAKGAQYASDARASSDNSWSFTSGYRGGSPANSQCLRAESSVPDWSKNWLAYTPFDMVALDQADLNTIPPGVLDALSDYLQAGGTIVIFGQKELPAVWHALASQTIPAGNNFSVGFGHCLLFSRSDPATANNAADLLRDQLRQRVGYWQSLPRDEEQANQSLQIVGSLKISPRGIVIIMLLFIIAIGPVNIIVLNRLKRRTWMLWTIPVISLVTTGLVFVYSLLREGITPDARIASITLIDQNTHHAATIGGTAFYCPLTPGGGLNYEYGTELTPLVSNESGTSREMDWSQSQHLQHGWVAARVPAFFHVRKSGTARERLELENDNGNLQIVNGLGAGIKSLWLADSRKRLYRAEKIPAGARAVLTWDKTSEQPGSQAGPAALLENQSFATHEETLEGTAQRFLSPGTYIAILDSNPFIENGLGTAAKSGRTRQTAIVYGVLDAPANP